MKHAVGLLILDDNIIFFKCWVILDCSVLSTGFGKPLHWKNLLQTLAFTQWEVWLNLWSFLVIIAAWCQQDSAWGFLTAYYKKLGGFGNLEGSYSLLDPGYILLITILLSPLQVYYF